MVDEFKLTLTNKKGNLLHPTSNASCYKTHDNIE